MAKQNSTSKSKLIDTAALTDRPTIRIKGEVYEIRTKSELSALDLSGIGNWLDRIGQLQVIARDTPDVVTDAERKEYADLLTLVCRRVVAASAEVLSAMDEADRQYAVNRFFVPFQQAIGELLGAAGTSPQTGTESSRS